MISTDSAQRAALLVACVATLFVAGCSSGEDAGGRAVGVVLLNGTPVQGGTIDFLPTQVGSSGYAQINDDGSFEAFTGASMAGIYPGEYKVGISSWTVEPGSTMENGSYSENGISAIPLQYNDPETSGLTASIAAEGQTDLVFNLEGEVDGKEVVSADFEPVN